ncbi:uncharacterized protein HD556DRAFT_1439412 [Suillus plorans]|uniref:DUF6533 domain-containing protein n=1 Tax=Suillus plorans TaxID=116603 RepID=A0A9P7DPC4_9AGAM|nr:uncharacterized protein HD556DRAFT_1439412 [Suillus plorans]KAG1799756.1 hypothetical protein HD556DRAFT_1439412 [Suillus plorans]
MSSRLTPRSNRDYGFVVAASAGVMYDWVVTFGQEVELVWRQRWSLVTVLFLSVRYLGISYAVTNILCFILIIVVNWIDIAANAILGVVMLVRLYAMYRRSRKVLIPLVVILVAGNIFVGVAIAIAIAMRDIPREEVIISGTYQCATDYKGDYLLLDSITWILGTVWEVLALFLAVWIAVKRFRELRRHPGRGIINDCFTVLMKTHLIYFASVVGVSCLGLGSLFSTILADEYALGSQIYVGLLMVFRFVQMFVLGPRLILGVREYHAKLVADSDAATAMTAIAFQERMHLSSSSDGV